MLTLATNLGIGVFPNGGACGLLVKPGAPDPRFGKSLEEMGNALMGQQITSTGNWMNDLGLWGKSMGRNWPSRLIGKGAMAIGENLGFGQKPPETFNPDYINKRMDELIAHFFHNDNCNLLQLFFFPV